MSTLNSLSLFIDSTCAHIRNELIYVFGVLCNNYRVSLSIQEQQSADSLTIALADTDIIFNPSNIERFQQLAFAVDFTREGFLKMPNGECDYLSTAFYLLSCAQEMDENKKDRLGRFPFAVSYQKHFNCANQNRVQYCFDQLVKLNPKLKHHQKPDRRSRIFLSHDVDFINGALLQDGFFALKALNVTAMFKIMFSNLLVKPQWLNMDKIMQIESEYDFKSTFYWLVNKGITADGYKNSDYDFNSERVQAQFKAVAEKGWENGLHKSISSESFDAELAKYGEMPLGNRYHFLKFRPLDDFMKIQQSGLKFDTSLGFAEEIGFRNNYGLPYHPYDFKQKKAFDFVECPLHVMDTTLHHYQKMTAKEAYCKIISFVEKNAQDAVISVLWHNNYFTPYKYGTYFKLYKDLLAYFYEHQFEGITQQEIIEQYS